MKEDATLKILWKKQRALNDFLSFYSFNFDVIFN